MATVKATFTLDEEAARSLAQTAARTGRAKSAVVRAAIVDYGKRADRLSESERIERLRVFDEVMSGPPTRPQDEVDAEIADIRESRRLAGEHRSDRLGE